MDNSLTKFIDLPNGRTLEVEMVPEFLKKIRFHFDLKDNETVTDDHIRMFIWGAFNTALEKSQLETPV